MPDRDPTRVPELPPSIPRRRSLARRLVGSTVLRLMGWRIDGSLPDLPKFVVIVAPHTSNWDFVVGFAVYLAIEIEARWLGKHTLFRWPAGPLFRHFGGIPVVRTQATNVVDLHVDEFRRRDRLVFVIAPEGTRRKTSGWKSGYYRIAVGAQVPIVPVALDFGTRTVRFFPPFAPTGNHEADLPAIQGHFQAGMARFPGNF